MTESGCRAWLWNRLGLLEFAVGQLRWPPFGADADFVSACRWWVIGPPKLTVPALGGDGLRGAVLKAHEMGDGTPVLVISDPHMAGTDYYLLDSWAGRAAEAGG